MILPPGRARRAPLAARGSAALTLLSLLLLAWAGCASQSAEAPPAASPSPAAVAVSNSAARALPPPKPSRSAESKAPARWVLVDGRAPAYTVYMALGSKEREQVLAKLPSDPSVVIYEWDDFLLQSRALLAERTARDDYPGSRACEGVVALLGRYPCAPFGLTWNGGIAITYNDYRFAEGEHGLYLRDPEAYQRRPRRDPRADPIQPRAHLGPLLGW